MITGRAADPSLFVAPLAYELRLGSSTRGRRSGAARSSATCSSARGRSPAATSPIPGLKDVARSRARSDFRSPRCRTRGRSSSPRCAAAAARSRTATCKEQLLYEIHDPAAYITPDVVADFSRVTVTELAHDRVAVDGATGASTAGDAEGLARLPRRVHRRRPDLVCRRGAVRRARLAAADRRATGCERSGLPPPTCGAT